MSDDDARLIGGVLARLESIEKHQESIRGENREDHAEIFKKINEISLLVPTVARHEKEIAVLKERPGRLIEIGSAAVAGVSALFMFFTRGH